MSYGDGTSLADYASLNFASTSVGVGAYVQLTMTGSAGVIADNTRSCMAVNTGAASMILASGPSGSQFVVGIILAGSLPMGPFPCKLDKGAKLWIKSTNGTISTGQIDLSFFY